MPHHTIQAKYVSNWDKIVHPKTGRVHQIDRVDRRHETFKDKIYLHSNGKHILTVHPSDTLTVVQEEFDEAFAIALEEVIREVETRQKGSVNLTKLSHRALSQRFDRTMDKHSKFWHKVADDTGTHNVRYSELMAKGDDFHPYIPKMKALMNHRDEIEREMKRRYGTSDFTVGRFKTYMAKT